MSIRPILNIVAASIALVFTLSGCGGGGGGASGETAPTAAAPSTPTAATVAALVPGAAMNWATARESAISVTVRDINGQPAAGAAVRVFTLSRISPQDATPLDEPVPVSLLDTVVSDATGRASLSLMWPGHVDELLVVATLNDVQGRTVLAGGSDVGAMLQLAR